MAKVGWPLVCALAVLAASGCGKPRTTAQQVEALRAQQERLPRAPECNSEAVLWRSHDPPSNPQPGDVWVNPNDEMQFVYIPPGDFILGTSDDEIDAWRRQHPRDARARFKYEQPQCRVRLKGYWIGRTEVANAQYGRFVRATGHPAPKHWTDGQVPESLKDHPVVHVDWDDARAYCGWAGLERRAWKLQVGKGAVRLPTELEWEKAARGADGRLYPWGSEWDPGKCRNPTQGASQGAAGVWEHPQGRSYWGVYQMEGNVWEWCDDFYDRAAYLRYAQGDLTPPAGGHRWRVQRGSSWKATTPGLFHFRSAYRGRAAHDHGTEDRGFRCARDAAL